MKILIVDDSQSMRRVEKQMLFETGLCSEVAEAADGIEALKMIAVERYDVVLMDWRMPDLSGIDVLRLLKANPDTASIPVVMVTSESQNQKIVEAINAGAANYIIKPFDRDILNDKLTAFKKTEGVSQPGTGQ